MQPQHLLSPRLLDAIYETTLDENLWPGVLGEVAQQAGAEGAGIFGESVTENVMAFEHNSGLSAACIAAYRARHLLNPVSLRRLDRPVGQLQMSNELVPLRELKKSSFFAEVLEPQGSGCVAIAALARRGGLEAALNIVRAERRGAFRARERRFLEALLPHLRRAVDLRFRFSGYQSIQQADSAALERVPDAVMLVDDKRWLTLANRAARALLADAGPLCTLHGKLGARNVSDAKRLNKAFATVAQGAPVAQLLVLHPLDGRPLAVAVHAIRTPDADKFERLGFRAVSAMIVVDDPAATLALTDTVLSEAFGLTAAECRVARVAARGAPLGAVALSLGLSANTIKTHLRHVYEKTGVRRQAELTRLFKNIG